MERVLIHASCSPKRLDRLREKLQRAQALLARGGGSAVLLGRFVAFHRAVMAALAGA